MTIVRAGREQAAAVVRLALMLWPDNAETELKAELAPLLESADAAFFLAQEQGGMGRVCAVPAPARLCGGDVVKPGRLSGGDLRYRTLPAAGDCGGTAGKMPAMGKGAGGP